MKGVGSWNKIGDQYIRKLDIFPLTWAESKFDQFHMAAAPNGGPIALVQKASVDAVMKIYTSAGKEISHWTWHEKDLFKLGWTDDEELVCVFADGNVQIYSVQGDRVATFSMGQECKASGVAGCVIWSKGVVCRTALTSQFYAVLDWTRPAVIPLANPRLPTPPSAMAVIPSTADKPVELILATANKGKDEKVRGSIMILDQKQAKDLNLDKVPFTLLAVAPGGGAVACVNDQGTMMVFSSDFSKLIAQFTPEAKHIIHDITWCGEDCVVVAYDKVLKVVGPFGDTVTYNYGGPVISRLHMVPECDGVRIITPEKCEFLQRVPDSSASIFSIGAVTPGSLLYDAFEAFEKKDVRADENIRILKTKNDLTRAIDDCLDAAAHEIDYNEQRKLLKAGSFGKLFSADYPADKMVDLCRDLRVLNAVRHPTVGIAITYSQYRSAPDVLIERLVNRHEHLLALRIAQYIRLPAEPILREWAIAKIKAGAEDDEALGRLIVAKLGACPGISFAEIATAAYKQGRKRLATVLLEREPRAIDQVPLLLSMEQEEVALDKAIESGDTDLVYLVLLKLRKKPNAEFFPLLLARPLAKQLYISYCKEADPESLKAFLSADQKVVEVANVDILLAYQQTDWKEKTKMLEVAKAFHAKDKSSSLMTQIVGEHLELLAAERSLEAELKTEGLTDLSPVQLAYKLFQSNEARKAVKVKLSQKQLWYVEVRARADAKAWEELSKMVANKKSSPIGFEPFVEVCVEAKEYKEAAKYIPRLAAPEEQMEWYCEIGYFKEAAEVAFKIKDMDALKEVHRRCRDKAARSHIEALMRALSGEK